MPAARKYQRARRKRRAQGAQQSTCSSSQGRLIRIRASSSRGGVREARAARQMEHNSVMRNRYFTCFSRAASRRALEKAGWKVADLDLIEANEAFAAQALAVNRDMAWNTEIVNVNGGAIAIGHPIGASGARILVTLLHEMQKRNAKRGLATLCIGGGMGVALTVER